MYCRPVVTVSARCHRTTADCEVDHCSETNFCTHQRLITTRRADAVAKRAPAFACPSARHSQKHTPSLHLLNLTDKLIQLGHKHASGHTGFAAKLYKRVLPGGEAKPS